jgi:hypothetical protein
MMTDITIAPTGNVIDLSPTENDNPFVGLRPYEADESFLFFGRDKQITELLQKLYTTRFIGVVGSSGCGKSSLIKAGLIPKLQAGFLTEERDHWMIASMRPGGDPVYFLAESLNESFSSLQISIKDRLQNSGFTSLKDITEKGVYALIDSMAPIFENNRNNLLLLVDQFEELFTTQRSGVSAEIQEKENVIFVNLLLTLAEQQKLPVYVIITMRSDYTGNCNKFSGLPEMLNRGQYLVPRLNRQQLQDVIEFPVKLYGRKISPRLVDQLLNDCVKDLDQLPVLQHCLMRTYQACGNAGFKNSMDYEHYETAGKLDNALSKHANEVYDKLDAGQKKIAKLVFRSLTDVNADNDPVRRRMQFKEVAAVCGNIAETEIKKVIDKFREPECAFLTPYTGKIDADTVIDISHESLMRQWDKLKEWMKEELDSGRKFEWLCESVSNNRERLRGIDLKDALNWKEKQQPNTAWAARYSDNLIDVEKYINDSVKKEYIRKVRKYSLITLFAIMAIVLISFQFKMQYDKATIAKKDQLRADSTAKKALESQTAIIESQKAIIISRDSLKNVSKELENNLEVQDSLQLSLEKTINRERLSHVEALKAKEDLARNNFESSFKEYPFYKFLSPELAEKAKHDLFPGYRRNDPEYFQLIDLLNRSADIRNNTASDPNDIIWDIKGIWKINKDPMIQSILLPVLNNNFFYKQKENPHESSYQSSFSIALGKNKFAFVDNDYDIHTGRYEKDLLIIDSDNIEAKKGITEVYRPGSILALGFSGNNLIGLSKYRDLIKWDLLKNRKDTYSFPWLTDNGLYEISPEGNWLLTTDNFKINITRWSLADLENIDNSSKIIDSSLSPIRQMKFSPNDSGFLILDFDGNLNYKSLNFDTAKKIQINKAERNTTATFSAEGKYVITSSTYGKIRLFDLNGVLISTSTIDPNDYLLGNIKSIELSSDWKQMVLVSDAGTMVHLRSGEPIFTRTRSGIRTNSNNRMQSRTFGTGNTLKAAFIGDNTILTANKAGDILLWKVYSEFKNLDDALNKIEVPAPTIEQQVKSGMISFADILASGNEQEIDKAFAKYYDDHDHENLRKAKQHYDKRLKTAEDKRLKTPEDNRLLIKYIGRLSSINSELAGSGLYLFEDSDSDPDSARFSRAYGNLAWAQVENKEFKNAIESARKGIALDPKEKNDWIYANLAVGYLFTNQYNEAKAIYIKYKDEYYDMGGGKEPFKQGFLDDFKKLEKLGVISRTQPEIYARVEKIKELLNKK